MPTSTFSVFSVTAAIIKEVEITIAAHATWREIQIFTYREPPRREVRISEECVVIGGAAWRLRGAYKFM